MRELKFRLWSKIAQCMIPWEEVEKKPYTIFDSSRWEPMQYTGIEDVNDIDIYEGDVCRVEYYNYSMPNTVLIQKVVFDNGTFALKSGGDDNLELEESRRFSPLYFCLPPNKIEVIGNIHEDKK